MRTFLLTTAIGLIAFLVSLDGFIINVAIPTISGELGVRNDEGIWLVTVFSMSSTLFIALSSWLVIRHGSITLCVASTLAFTLFSFLCGIAPSFTAFLIFRFLQGAAAGLLTPLTLALIVSTFPPEKRGVAVGLWSFFVMVSPAMGPMIGGLFSTHLWHWMFFLNIPFGILSAALIWILTRGQKEQKEPIRLDTVGIALAFLFICTLQSALNRGQIDDWFDSPLITTLLILSALGFIFFLIWESFQKNPFISMSVLCKRNFALSASMIGIGMGLLFSSFILESLWVQRTLGYTPFWAGLSLMPVGLFPIILYPIMGRIVGYLDRRIWLTASFLLYAITFFLLSRIDLETSFGHLAIIRLVQGIGFSMFTVPVSLIAMEGVEREKLPFNISLFAFCRTLSVGLMIPLSTTLWIRREAFYTTRLAARTFPNNPIFQEVTKTFSTLEVSGYQPLALTNDFLVNQASTLGLADIYYLYAWIFLGLLVLVFLVKPQEV